MRKAIAILPVVSAIYPMITGATAPPTIVMISNEEASLVLVPASLNASEKSNHLYFHTPSEPPLCKGDSRDVKNKK